jgi:hypothetical protein
VPGTHLVRDQLHYIVFFPRALRVLRFWEPRLNGLPLGPQFCASAVSRVGAIRLSLENDLIGEQARQEPRDLVLPDIHRADRSLKPGQ